MLKNLKISNKLLLGFGLVLLMFIIAAFAMQYYINITKVNSNYLAKEVMQALELAISLKEVANNVFIAMRTVRFTEKPETIAEYWKHTEKAIAIRDEIIKLNEKNPELQSAAHVLNAVFPLTIKYMELAEKSFPLIEKKQILKKKFSEAGYSSTNDARAILDNIQRQLEISIRNRNANPDLTNAIELGTRLLEKNIYLRRDVWEAVAVVQSGGDIKGLRDATNKIKDLLKLTDDLYAFFYRTEDRKMLENMMNNLKTYEANLNEFVKTYMELEQIHETRLAIMYSLEEEIRIAEKKAITRTKEISEENSAELSFAITLLFLSTGCAIVFGTFIIVFIARSISKPLNTIVKLAKRAGNGDLTIKKEDFGYDSSDELGSMVTAMASMVDAQNSTMTQIIKIANDLSEGASDLYAISEQTNAVMDEIKITVSHVSNLSESNGEALEQSNAGVEEMSAGADTVAKSATDSASFISQTTGSSNDAIQTVSNVIEGMRDVNRNAEVSEEKIRQLVLSVENVSSFVSVITGIADQTNLLALNAAIEAARAGEVGRGFAVVAEEVRKLAEESAKASNNVNMIIKELQNGAQESIKATTEAGRLLTSTLNQAEHALIELNGALNQMNNANDSIQNIAAVAEEQAASSREVALAIDIVTKSTIDMVGTVASIHKSTDEAVQASDGVAKQAEAMAEYSRTLSELLSVFRLRD